MVVNFWEWNPTGHLGPSFSIPFSCFVGGSHWYRIAPVLICDVSTSSSNCLEGSGLTSTGGFVMVWMICSCAASCSCPHLKGTPLPVSQVMGAAMAEKFLMNILWYPVTPRKPLACLRLTILRGYSAIPVILAGLIVVLCFEMHTPRKSIWGCMKIDLDSFRCRPCSARRSKRKWVILICSGKSLSVVPNPKSSM